MKNPIDSSNQELTDEILDKISKYGIGSISTKEIEFLDAISSGDIDDVIDKLDKLNSQSIFEDDHFRFELDNIHYGDEFVEYNGTLFVPDLKLSDGSKVDGMLVGRILLFNNGIYSIDFEKKSKNGRKTRVYDVFEFCMGLEYELDSFIDYVIEEL